jgi:hypothetical membrane protein
VTIRKPLFEAAAFFFPFFCLGQYNGEMPVTPFFQIYPYFGLVGSLVVMLAVVISALRYRGRRSESYSLFNHFISELGEVGVSCAAAVFNTGLILGGILLLPFILGLGLTLNNTSAYLGTAAGTGAAIFCTLVGVYPMNNLTPHIRAAVWFFRTGLLTLLFFSLAVLVQPASIRSIPLYTVVFGIIGVTCYAAFLILLMRKPAASDDSTVLDPEAVPERPRFWLSAMLEWAVFFTTIFWFLSMAVAILL